MNIQEMHNTFRTLGQQMGLQLIRGILPESIDVYLNDVIFEATQQELINGVRVAMTDGVNTQASTMTLINSFRTLYKSSSYVIDTDDVDQLTKKVNYYNPNNGFHIINLPIVNTAVELSENEHYMNAMQFLGFDVEYENSITGSSIGCRLIGADVLEATLRDYCNGASKDAPIAVLNSHYEDVNYGEQLRIYTSTPNCKITRLNVKYVKTPNIVKWNMNLEDCVNCDLPEYTHYKIVEMAVMKFHASMMGTIAQQQLQQPEQQRRK